MINLKQLKNLLIAVSVILLCSTACTRDIEINAKNFPDKEFRYYVWELIKLDTDVDNKISAEEFAIITHIDVSNRGFKSLKGIEYFTALTSLNCDGNKLTSLDVSKNTALTYLGCSSNQLTSLDISKDTALIYLNCGGNNIPEGELPKVKDN